MTIEQFNKVFRCFKMVFPKHFLFLFYADRVKIMKYDKCVQYYLISSIKHEYLLILIIPFLKIQDDCLFDAASKQQHNKCVV